ncbi:putative Early nodulin 16 [Hibiscus syriacus]|uniref:Early nodulin 16 n=1 Tax=Hibiscus syriacus TaxID=106335 RepID=A0A6A3CJJ8_HIBSY|nr:putative Early nodulin 16 [Hibiscus syriacus]
MGGKIGTATLFVFLVANLLQGAFGVTYTVGDSTGWVVPTGNDDFYDDWADNKIFAVGDVLVFNFTTGQHDVLEVTEADYDNCNAANPISNVTNGPTRITLDRTGDHYFICGFPGHCAAGQKLNVEVRNGNRNGTAPTPRPSPTTPATPSGMTYTVGDSTGWRVPTGNMIFMMIGTTTRISMLGMFYCSTSPRGNMMSWR